MVFEMLGGACSKCGGNEDLEIDHIDPSKKSFPISKMWSVNEELFLEEAKKCQLLCHEHHVEKTISDRGFNSSKDHGTYACYRHGGCRCEECRVAARIANRKWREKRKQMDR